MTDLLKVRAGLVVAAVGWIAAAQGCRATAEDASGAGAAGPSEATSTTGMSASTASTGGIDANVDCASAVALSADMPEGVTAELDPVGDDEDFFRFSGTQGQVVLLYGDAKPDYEGFAFGRPDLVFTLFNSQEEKIAENDDALPRTTQDSSLFTVLPSDGDYCLRVTEFCRWAAINQLPQDQQCPPGTTPVVIPTFTARLAVLDPATHAYHVVHSETNPIGTAMKYEKLPMGAAYFPTLGTVALGVFGSDSDEDVFSFDIPSDTACNPMGDTCVALAAEGAQRTTAYFWLFPAGAAGDGATVPIGRAWVTTGGDPLTKIAEVDAVTSFGAFRAGLQVPVDFDVGYQLHLQPGGTSGSQPFYFVAHHGGGSYPLEHELGVGDNDTTSTAEDMLHIAYLDGGDGYAVAGTISGGTGDLDVYRFDDLQIGPHQLLARCAAWRIGSGLRGLTLRILDENGNPLPRGDASEETAATDTATLLVVPEEATDTMFLEVETTTPPDPTIAGEYYQCDVSFIL